MAAPGPAEVGTPNASVGDLTIARAGLTIGATDILLLPVLSADGGAAAPAAGGWAHIPDSPQFAGGGTLATRVELAIFWVRGDPGSDPVILDTGNHQFGVIIRVPGCITTGNPWDVTAGDLIATADTAVSIPGDTTTVVDCLVLAFGSSAFDSTTPQFSSWANASLSSFAELVNIATDVGNGSALGVATGIKAAAGAYSATTATLANSSKQGRISIALKPPPAAGPNTGAATGAVDWVGSSTGARASAGASTGAVTWVGSSTGARVSAGAGTGAIAWVGSATGEMPVEVQNGEGIGAITWVGTATGTSTHSGTATGAIGWSGASSGVSEHSGAATGAIAWVGTAQGVTTHSGASTGAVTWVGAATGESPAPGVQEGSADGTITWAGTATGSSTHSGASAGTITWVGTATGTTTHAGTAVGAIAWVGTATGNQPLGIVFDIGGGGRVTGVSVGGGPTITVENA